MNVQYKTLGKVSFTPEGEWNKDKDYEKLSVVTDIFTNKTYVSKKYVPVNIDISNIDYWMPIAAGGYKNNNFIVISDKDENGNLIVYTLQNAINSIHRNDRQPGCILGFYGVDNTNRDNEYTWYLYQFKSDDIKNWEDVNYWQSIYDNINKFKGYFIDYQNLVDEFPKPNIGDFAFVGNNLDTSIYYYCSKNNVWTTDNKRAFDFISRFDAINSEAVSEPVIENAEEQIEQLTKEVVDQNNNIEKKYVFPVTAVQAIFDINSGNYLDEILENIDDSINKHDANINDIKNNINDISKSISDINNSIDSIDKDITDNISGENPIITEVVNNTDVKIKLKYGQGLSIDQNNSLTLKLATNQIGNVGGLNYDSTGLKINTGDGLQVKEGELTIKTGTGISFNNNGELVNTVEIDVDDSLDENSENPVQNKVITEPINKLMDKVFPTTFSVSGGEVFKKGSTQNITVKWSLVRDGQVVVPDTITINGTNVENTSTSKTYTGVTTNTTYSVAAIKTGKTYTGSTSVTFINPKYFGAVDTVDVTEAIIKGLSESVSNGNGYTGTIPLNNQRTCYAYPKSFGALTAIKDANNFDYLASYVRKEITVWNEVYYVYILEDATTHANFKQIYS